MATRSGKTLRDVIKAPVPAMPEQTAAALQRSEQCFRATFEQAAVGMAHVGLDGRWLRVNRKLLAIVGYAEAELLSKTLQDITDPTDLESDLGYLGQLLAGEIATLATEKRYVRRDGTLIWINLTLSLVRDNAGAPDYFIAVLDDISQRKAADAALAEANRSLQDSEQRFRLLVNGLPQLVWTCLADGACDFLNRQWLEYTGLPAETQLGYGWLQQLHPDDRAPTLAAWSVAASQVGEFNVEFRIRRHDGVYRWFKTRALPVRDEAQRVVKWIGSNTDISDIRGVEREVRELNASLEQRVAERTAALSEAATRLEATNASLRRIMAVTDAVRAGQAGFIATEHPAELFGRLLQNLLDLTGSEYGFIDELQTAADGQPEFVARAITDISWSEETRRLYPKFLSGELTFRNLNSLFGAIFTSVKPVIANDAPHDSRRCGVPSGHPALNRFLGLPLVFNKEFVGIVGLANRAEGYDEALITELEPLTGAVAALLAAWQADRRRCAMELNLQQANEQLRGRSAELEAVNNDLESFSYSVSHDLRVPLRAIDGFSQMLESGYGDRLDDEGRRLLSVVRASAQRMARLIDDVLAFSRVGRTQMRVEPIDMNAMVRDVLGELALLREGRAIEMSSASLPPAHGDAAMLRQVWINLLANAIKFTRARPSAHIAIGGRREDEEVRYWVQDDGVGFDMQYAHKLFDVFQRLHGVDEFEGTGAGLAIVSRVITRHGGRVWAEGRVNEGATFGFALPVPAMRRPSPSTGPVEEKR